MTSPSELEFLAAPLGRSFPIHSFTPDDADQIAEAALEIAQRAKKSEEMRHGRTDEQVDEDALNGMMVQYAILRLYRDAGYRLTPFRSDVATHVDWIVEDKFLEVKSFTCGNSTVSFNHDQKVQTIMANYRRLDFLIACKYFKEDEMAKLGVASKSFIMPWLIIDLETFSLSESIEGKGWFYKESIARQVGRCSVLNEPLPALTALRFRELYKKEGRQGFTR